jgi:thioredoxin-related protein
MRNKMIFAGLLVIVVIFAFAFIPGIKNSIGDNKTPVGKEQGIQFIESSWNKALEEAKSQKKLIFLDAYASWCGPCKQLKRNTFPNKEAGEFFNTNFINVAIDMEKGDGPELAMKYGVNAYPTLIIADSLGNIVTYTQGYMKPKQLIEFGKYGLEKGKK